MVAHARRDHPYEACGIRAGREGEDRAERIVPMLNAARSPTYYEFDATEWNAVYREMSANDEEPVVIYHSHTATEPYPSRTDIARAGEYATLLPSPHYVLIGTRDPERQARRSYRIDEAELPPYRIDDGEVTEEPVEVVESEVHETQRR